MKQKYLLALFTIQLLIVFASCNLKMLTTSHKDLGNLKGFKCFGATKVSTPIRLTSKGEIECFSVDGKDCSSNFSSDHSCRAYVMAHRHQSQPVKCTPEQYNKADHWCSEGKKFFYKKWHCPDETGLKVAIRFDEKSFRVNCLSVDGKKCVKGKAARKMCTKANHCDDFRRKIKSRVCKRKNNTAAKRNWCKRGFAYFRHSSKFFSYRHTKTNMALRLSKAGDVQCLSKDGTKCVEDLNTVEKFTKAVLEGKDKGFKKAKTLSCGAELKEKQGITGFDKPDSWCQKGYRFLYFRNKTPKDPKVQQIKTRITRKYVPKWFKILLNFIKSPEAKTREGLKNIKKTIIKHGFRNKNDKFDKLKDLIKAGIANTKDGVKKIKQIIKKNTPRLRGRENRGPKKSRKVKKTKFPKWFTNIEKILNRPIIKTDKGLNYIKKVLQNRGFQMTPKRWQTITTKVKNGDTKAIIKIIKNHTPSISMIQKKLDTRNPKPKWFQALIKVIRHPRATTDKGLRVIKEVLRKHNFQFTPKIWDHIKTQIKEGNVLHTPSAFRKIIATIKKNTPSLNKNKKKKTRGVYLNLDGNKKCGRKFFRKLRKLLKSKESKNAEGLQKIKKFLNNHFEVNSNIWNKIEGSIKDGTLKTSKGRKSVVKDIKNHIPMQNLPGKKNNKQLALPSGVATIAKDGKITGANQVNKIATRKAGKNGKKGGKKGRKDVKKGRKGGKKGGKGGKKRGKGRFNNNVTQPTAGNNNIFIPNDVKHYLGGKKSTSIGIKTPTKGNIGHPNRTTRPTSVLNGNKKSNGNTVKPTGPSSNGKFKSNRPQIGGIRGQRNRPKKATPRRGNKVKSSTGKIQPKTTNKGGSIGLPNKTINPTPLKREEKKFQKKHKWVRKVHGKSIKKNRKHKWIRDGKGKYSRKNRRLARWQGGNKIGGKRGHKGVKKNGKKGRNMTGKKGRRHGKYSRKNRRLARRKKGRRHGGNSNNGRRHGRNSNSGSPTKLQKRRRGNNKPWWKKW